MSTKQPPTPTPTPTATATAPVVTLSKYSKRVILKTILGRGDGGVGLVGDRVVIGGWVKTSKEVTKKPVPPPVVEGDKVGSKDVTCVEIIPTRLPFFRSIMKVFVGSHEPVREKLDSVVQKLPPPPPPLQQSSLFAVLQVSDGSCAASLQVAEAKRMYHAIQKKHFTFDTCWDILRRSCKWDEFRTQSKKSTQHAYPCSNPPTGESDALQSNQNNVLHEQASNPSTRPIGTKAAKEKLKNQTTHDSRFDEMAANQSKIIEVLSTISARTIERDEQKAIDREQKAADRRRRAEDREEQLKLLSMMNEREQRNEDHKLMSMDMTNLNPMQRAYYEDLQRQILFRTTNRLP